MWEVSEAGPWPQLLLVKPGALLLVDLTTGQPVSGMRCAVLRGVFTWLWGKALPVVDNRHANPANHFPVSGANQAGCKARAKRFEGPPPLLESMQIFDDEFPHIFFHTIMSI